MKQLLATTLAFILLGTSAFGAEIKMECELPSAVWYFKYAERTLTKDKVVKDEIGRIKCLILSLHHLLEMY